VRKSIKAVYMWREFCMAGCRGTIGVFKSKREESAGCRWATLHSLYIRE
jgi:hypothetical protein